MSLRTDLAIEQKNGTEKVLKNEKIQIFEIREEDKKSITILFEGLEKITDYDELERDIKNQLASFLEKSWKSFFVIGLGNREITPDSIGPLTAEKILATRHITGEFAERIGLSKLKSVSVLVPNVLGKTGLETGEFVETMVKKIKPDAVIVIDALASASIKRIFRTVQISNGGISPGSGVKNSRKEISFKTLKVPVIAMGVPTVMTAENLAFELCKTEPEIGEEMIVTPKDNDLLCHRISEILASALNEALQPDLDREILKALV